MGDARNDLPGHAREGLELTSTRRSTLRGDPLLRRVLALADVLTAVVVSLSLGLLGAGLDSVLWALVFTPVWLLLAKFSGLYDRDQRSLRHLTIDEFPALFMWALSSIAALAALLVLTPVASLALERMVAACGTAVVSAVLLRGLARSLWRRFTQPERTLIIGSGSLADVTRRKLELFRDIHVEVVDQRETLSSVEFEAAAETFVDIDRIILASQSIDEQLIAELVSFGRRHHMKLSVVPPARGLFGTAVQLNHVADLPIVEYNTWDVSRSTLLFKRTLDVVVSSVALVLLSPVFAVVALAVRLDSPGSVIFSQRRAGKDARPFRMYKFRTMVSDAEQRLSDVVSLHDLRVPVFKLTNDPRVTRLGRLLRRASLDELPQLLNVLRGEMSLVGPRPEQVELVDRYRPEHRFRVSVKPGITGPMQVFGRGQLSWDERLAVEREYVENLSLRRDLRILGMTFAAVFSGRGAF